MGSCLTRGLLNEKRMKNTGKTRGRGAGVSQFPQGKPEPESPLHATTG